MKDPAIGGWHPIACRYLDLLSRYSASVFQRTYYDSESQRQTAVQAAISASGGSTAIQAAITAAKAVHFRRVIAACVASGVEAGLYREALHEIVGVYS